MAEHHAVDQRLDPDLDVDECGVNIVSPQEGWGMLDRQTRRVLGISGEEFPRRWDAGEYADDPDQPGCEVCIHLCRSYAQGPSGRTITEATQRHIRVLRAIVGCITSPILTAAHRYSVPNQPIRLSAAG